MTQRLGLSFGPTRIYPDQSCSLAPPSNLEAVQVLSLYPYSMSLYLICTLIIVSGITLFFAPRSSLFAALASH